MSDDPSNSENEAPNPASDAMAAFSSQLDQLKDALDILYIPYNASGRNKFRDKHEAIAQYIFGSQLIEYDNKGTKDYDHRSELEGNADERRIQLKITMSEMIDKSVEQGSLQFDYVGGIIDKYGVALSQFLYKDDIIERVRPGLLAKLEAEINDTKEEEKNTPDINNDNPIQDKPLSEEEKSILSNEPVAEPIEAEPIEEPEKIISYKELFNLLAIGK